MTIQAHIGERGVARVVMHDAQGNETGDYDIAGGIAWSSTHPDIVRVTDDDARPEDASIEFLSLLENEEAFITCSFDGAVGDDERRIELRSEGIMVVPGEATGGVISITMSMV